MPAPERFAIDLQTSVTRDEAVELCVHHLQLAAAYFEATPDDAGLQLAEEIERAVRASASGTIPDDPPWARAAHAWAEAIKWVFESMNEDD